MTDDRADDRRLKKQVSLLNARQDKALNMLLSVSEGRDFLWWLLGIGKVGTTPLANDAHGTAFLCGELNVGNQILARIQEVNPEGYLVMLKEQLDARRAADTTRNTSSDTADDGTPELYAERFPDDPAG